MTGARGSRPPAPTHVMWPWSTSACRTWTVWPPPGPCWHSPPHAAVVILTTFRLDEYVAEAVQAGAAGFLLKDTPPTELVRAVHTVAGGDAMLSPR